MSTYLGLVKLGPHAGPHNPFMAGKRKNDPWAMPAMLRRQVASAIKKELKKTKRNTDLESVSTSIERAYYFYHLGPLKPLGLNSTEKRKLRQVQAHAKRLSWLLRDFPFWEETRNKLTEIAELVPDLLDFRTESVPDRLLSKARSGPAPQRQLVWFSHLMASAFREIHGIDPTMGYNRRDPSWESPFKTWLVTWCDLLKVNPPSDDRIKAGIKSYKRTGSGAVFLWQEKKIDEKAYELLKLHALSGCSYKNKNN